MEISHNDALDLENLVRKVHNCERFGMGMYIDADILKQIHLMLH